MTDIYDVLCDADQDLMPVGVARLLVAKGFRAPNVADENQVDFMTAVIHPAVYFEGDEDEVNAFVAGLLVSQGVGR